SKAFVTTACEAPLDNEIVVFNVAKLLHSEKKSTKDAGANISWSRQTRQHANPPNFTAPIGLLRSYGQRPSGGRAAEQRDEAAPFHRLSPRPKGHRPRIAGLRLGVRVERRNSGCNAHGSSHGDTTRSLRR